MKRFAYTTDTTSDQDCVPSPLPAGGWPRRVGPGLIGLTLPGLLLVSSPEAHAQALDLGRQTGISDAASADLYTQYSRANLNLTPLAQIDAWLGFLKLHPETPYRDQIRWRLRYLASNLSERDESQLLAILAYQQLPDRLASLEDPTLRLQACGEFIQAFPALFDNHAYHSSFLTLLERLGNRDPEAFVVRFLNTDVRPESLVASNGIGSSRSLETSAPGVGRGNETPVIERPSDGRAPEASGGIVDPGRESSANAASSADKATAVASTLQGSAATTAGAGADTSAGAGTNASMSGNPASGVTGIADAGKASNGGQKGAIGSQSVASLPATGSAGAAVGESSPILSESMREADRFLKWTVATQNLTPEARLQLWTTYLLLYPDTPHLETIQARIARASEETQAVKQKQEDVQARLLALESEVAVQHDNQQAEQEHQQNRRTLRRVLLGLGGLLLLSLLMGAL